MKELYEGAILNKKELMEWFGISSNSFTSSKKQKLEELKDFCDYELITTSKGYFKEIRVLKVYNSKYSRRMNPLKKHFLDWIKGNGIAEVATQTPDKAYSYPTVINYYCKKNNIPYDGAHYLKIIEDGNNSEERKIYNGQRKISNKEYSEWHYLYRVLKKYCSDNNIRCGDRINCCSASFNPTVLRKETEVDRDLQNLIYQKYFGKLAYSDVCDLVDEVTNLVESGEITSEVRDSLIENKLMRTYTDKQKRQLAAEECVELGILRRKGYIYEDGQAS